MYLTEEEARIKTCIWQFAILMNLVDSVPEGSGKILSEQKQCLASDCMMWPRCNKEWDTYEGPGGKP